MKLIIINGPSGIGKSTLAVQLHQEIPSSFLVDIDELRRTIIPDYRERREESLRLSEVRAAEIIEEQLKSGHDVIIDKAILNEEVLESFVQLGNSLDAQVFEFFLFTDKETLQKRADDRGYKPGGLLTRERVGELWEKANALKEKRSDAIIIDTTNTGREEVFNRVTQELENSTFK